MTDKGDVIKGLEKVWDAFNHMEHELYADYVFDALAMLKEQPDIVRCRDCKWRSEKGFCKHPDGGAGNIRPSNWFCADGVKK